VIKLLKIGMSLLFLFYILMIIFMYGKSVYDNATYVVTNVLHKGKIYVTKVQLAPVVSPCNKVPEEILYIGSLYNSIPKIWVHYKDGQTELVVERYGQILRRKTINGKISSEEEYSPATDGEVLAWLCDLSRRGKSLPG
jgi:hypothetical protein